MGCDICGFAGCDLTVTWDCEHETAGEILAREFIYLDPDDQAEWGPSCEDFGFFPIRESDEEYGRKFAAECRRELAARVDKAIAAARGEQREADARVAERTTIHADCPGYYGCKAAAIAIRNNK
jgi:hypothetical protein